MASLEVYPLVDRLQNAIVSYVAYVGKLIWPARLSPFYPFRFDVTLWQVGGAALALVAVSYWAIRSIRRRPYVAVGWFWYLVSLVPVIGLVQIGEQAMADRYTYIPGIGLLIVVCWLVRDLGRRRGGATAVVAVATAVVLIALALQTQAQVRYWRDDETLFRHAVGVTPDSSLAHLNLGRELVRQGRLEEAARHFRRTLEIRPDHDVAHNNLGMIALYDGRTERAIEHFERAVAINPGEVMYHANLAAALATARRFDESAEQFTEAVRLDPHGNVAVAGLASHMTSLGSIMFRRGRIGPATKLLDGAVVIDPDLLSARIGLGRASLANRRAEDALDQFKKAAELISGLHREPREHDRSITAQVYFSYGYALAAVGRAEAAAEQYREALRVQPGMPNAIVGLAWLLATTDDDGLRDPEQASSLAAEACRRTGNRNPKALDALAAAYAASGRFEDAVAVAQRAIVAAAGRPALAEAIQRRADGYRTRTPYTEHALDLDE